MTKYLVVLRRDNGRWVKEVSCSSKYAAKKLKSKWEDKYDHTYYVEIKGVT